MGLLRNPVTGRDITFDDDVAARRLVEVVALIGLIGLCATILHSSWSYPTIFARWNGAPMLGLCLVLLTPRAFWKTGFHRPVALTTAMILVGLYVFAMASIGTIFLILAGIIWTAEDLRRQAAASARSRGAIGR